MHNKTTLQVIKRQVKILKKFSMGLTTSSIQQEGISIGGSFHPHVIEYHKFSVLNFLLISYLNFLNL